MDTRQVRQQENQPTPTGQDPAPSARDSVPPVMPPVTAPLERHAAVPVPNEITAHPGNPTAAVEGDSSPAAPEVPSAPIAIDADELARLVAALQAHARRRQPLLMAAPNDPQEAVLRAACLTLIGGPSELGTDISPSPLRDQVYATLRDAGSQDIPEVHVCRLWLSCAAGEGGVHAVDSLVALVQASLWEPMQALAYRALAYYGRRHVLAEVLPQEGALSLAQADAWLEATHATDIVARWTERIMRAPDSPLPPAVCERWTALLTSETALACGDHPAVTEDALASLAALADPHPPRTYAEAETQRLAARAAAALARARLARWRDDGGALTSPAGRLLPAWERGYLQALTHWQRHDDEAAALVLQDALEQNPHQTSIRLALASLLAARSPEVALHMLVHAEPTREVYAMQAALLARLGRYGEAEDALTHCAGCPAAGSEPARCSWARGRQQFRQQEQALRTALAEHRADWHTAGMAWRTTDVGARQKTLQEARQLFVAHRELTFLTAGQSWRRSLIEQRVARGVHEVGTIPLVGDALFFRAAAFIDTLPERAVRDFQTLLRQRGWVDAERRVGGGRIIFVGDALWRLGQFDEAIRAYELASASRSLQAHERLALALVNAEVRRSAGLDAISRAVGRAVELAPTSPWPQLLAALGLLMAGEVEATMSHLDAAAACGAPESICRGLRAVCTALSGRAVLAEEDLVALHLTVVADAIVRLVCDEGTEPARIEAFVRAFGDEWIAWCPTDPQRTARRLLAAWCDRGNWDEVLEYVDRLERSALPWAKELAALVRVRHALESASRGALEAADRALQELETWLQSGPE